MKLLLENWREYVKEEEEVNEIFGMGKKYIDLDETHLHSIMISKVAVNNLVKTLEKRVTSASLQDFLSNHRSLIEDSLKDLIEEYEKKIDPMLSRLMVAKKQIDKETHRVEPAVANSIKHYLDDVIVSWKDDPDLLRQLMEVVANLRNKILGAYKKHRNRAGLPAYKPKPSMHDLENLMGKVKER